MIELSREQHDKLTEFQLWLIPQADQVAAQGSADTSAGFEALCGVVGHLLQDDDKTTQRASGPGEFSNFVDADEVKPFGDVL